MQLLHGSGKTAVLVERVIRKIIDEKIDIDRLLIVTFTNAAASQMREKILQAIYNKLEQEPQNSHLQRQIVLMNKASISTIHSFCLDVIKNHFYEIGISPNFRMGDTSELELLKQEVIDELFEKKYEQNDEDFAKLIECYANYRGDDDLKELVFKIDTFIQSSPFPKKWLEEAIERFNISNKAEDFGKTIWGEILLNSLKEKTNGYYIELSALEKKLKEEGLDVYAQTISEDKKILSGFLNVNNWDEAHIKANGISFAKWPVDRKLVSNLKDIAKDKRSDIKKKFTDALNLVCIYSSEEAIEDIVFMKPILESLKNLVILFEEKYNEAKKEKNIIDFHDMEHFALQILEKEEIAKEYKEKYYEIAIDEYQDSNLTQDYLLNLISRGNNIFMVGDVKQSIYKFRQARPKLFLDKYETYGTDENDGIKVLLYKNFRSRKEVVDFVNDVFLAIMSKKLGDIEYTKEEYLNLGAEYEPEEDENKKTELHIIDTKLEEDEDTNVLEKSELEARFAAQKITELINSNYMIKDGDEYRKISYKDIVVLLRAPSNITQIYEKEFMNFNIPVYSDIDSMYLDSQEITTVLSLLKIIDNPNQDIPLVTVLRSPMYSFDDNELIQIKLFDRNGSYYDAIKKASEEAEDPLKTKINSFLDSINLFRNKQEYMPLNELIWYIYEQTGYMAYIKLTTNGLIKSANLKMLFERAKDYEHASFKGLYNFIHYIERMKKIGQDFGGAKIIGENEDIVRIMSIHKSKGLEFPIVFICGLGKNFNFRDLNERVLLHQDIGFGPKYINYSRQIEYDTLAKEAIKESSKQEEISEEMRVLYVGLTRAKEKLILIGTQKEAEKEIESKKDLLEDYSNEKLPSELVRKYTTFLDWIELVYLKNNLKMNIHMQKDLEQNIEVEKIKEDNAKNCITDEDKKKLEDILNWKYPNCSLITIPSKSSVTSLKNLSNGKENIISECSLQVPDFIKEEKTLTGAQKGTIMHLVLQKIDLRKTYTNQELEGFLDELVAKKIITVKERETVNISKIEIFLNSNLAEEIRNAKTIYKEKPFYIYLPVKDIYGGDQNEKIVVQGIIDLYYVNKDGETILVDYKTDYVELGNERDLLEKYRSQIDIYKKAIEQGTGSRVNRAYIYSMYLGKEILVT